MSTTTPLEVDLRGITLNLLFFGRIGVRQRFIGLLAFAMLPLTCVVGFFLWVDHNQTIENARNGVFSAAQLAAGPKPASSTRPKPY